MASTGNMKGFYRQRKTTATKKSSKKSPIPTVIQTPATSSGGRNQDLQSECNESEVVLRQFDLNMAYGPCLGIARLARWERAQRLGLNPPQEIESLLKSGKVQMESLWGGRI
ncbi:DNA polymerase delta subunit 4 isoform X1 [Vigna umbellata]|uniref:DNA polymerase delta subunit 4 isoform X1 n=1 Tax=Vigna umbellata TaxID=87088 RepID=UPI001F5EF97A|nr:DNA polymerase delta subunit 4 isoform X1 [Vigna umbellata]